MADITAKEEKRRILGQVLSRLRRQRLFDIDLQLGHGGIAHGHDEPVPPLSLSDLHRIRRLFADRGLSARAVYMAEDLFVRTRVEPVQAMLTEWMAGAKAQVDGEDIPFRQIITWCQECESWDRRHRLAIEARSLCRFLAPFSHATWKALEAAVTEELGYGSYLEYCQARRDIDLGEEASRCRRRLDERRSDYLDRLESWFSNIFPGRELSDANRFDAIYLLGMRYMDHLAGPEISLEGALDFFSGLGIDDKGGLDLHIDGQPGRQSYCVPVAIPGKIHLIIGPVSGWVDWEALFHEMGHAFSFMHTDPSLPLEAREFFLSGALSEAFAFVFQRLCMKEAFLSWISGREDDSFSRLEQLQHFKFQLLERRYGAKFLIEYENFRAGRVSRGQGLYARVMAQETGFSYDPETYLFDLMPDFYSLDYYLAFIASDIMIGVLEDEFGPRWFQQGQALERLRHWASFGNLYEIHEFMERVVGCGLFHQGP